MREVLLSSDALNAITSNLLRIFGPRWHVRQRLAKGKRRLSGPTAEAARKLLARAHSELTLSAIVVFRCGREALKPGVGPPAAKACSVR